MEMDVPLPEELEWLESNTNFDEEEDYELEDEGEELLELCRAIPDDEPVCKNQKRQRVDGEEDREGSGRPSSVEKRSKVVDLDPVDALDPEEEWLRYSPRRDPVDYALFESGPADGVTGEDDTTPEVIVEERIISRFVSEIDGDCIPVTGPRGDRVYAKMSSVVAGADMRSMRMDKPAKGLLLEPINVLLERVDGEAIQAALQKSSAPPSSASDSIVSMGNEQLWVEKYAPNSFLELLSDEQTNREVLLWLKQWDSCVFGSHIRATTDDVFSALRRHSSVAQHQRLSNSKMFKSHGVNFSSQKFAHSNILDRGSENSKEPSESWCKKPTVSCPPEQKVLLLCGPPGLGKTTLAHVAAKHCGYRVVEINASDERSSSTIESKILDVVQMNSVMADSKPKCLVIDEIDGALGEGKGAVDVILKMIAAEAKSTGDNNQLEAQSRKSLSKKGFRTRPLSRPVICICNDLYAPALRPLRHIAKVLTFVQPTISRVVNRLRYICKREGFKTSSVALSSLAECTECDIRSCLNTLQFLKKKNGALNILEVDSQVVGRKDISRTAFDVWKEILQKRALRKERSRNLRGASGDFEILYSLVANRGEYELTMDGIYENFLQLYYHDPVMQKTVGCLDVLGVSDSLHRYIMRTQQMSLMAYQPFIAISMRNLVAQVDRPHIEWPKSLRRCHTMLMEKKDLLKCWHSKLSPSITRHLSTESFVEDFVSPLLHILSPPAVRPVALHLLSEREKDDLTQLVDTMASYSISYKNPKPEAIPRNHKFGAASDMESLSLDPPIDGFVKFKDYQAEYRGLSLAVKQVLVHEVEKHKIMIEGIGRRLDVNDGSNKENRVSLIEKTKSNSNAANLSAASAEINNGSLRSKLTPESNRSLPAPGMKLQTPGNSKKYSAHSTNFFDRFRKGKKDGENSGSSVPKPTLERDQRPFLFKYNEGFTNAVKRPVRMRELLS